MRTQTHLPPTSKQKVSMPPIASNPLVLLHPQKVQETKKSVFFRCVDYGIRTHAPIKVKGLNLTE